MPFICSCRPLLAAVPLVLGGVAAQAQTLAPAGEDPAPSPALISNVQVHGFYSLTGLHRSHEGAQYAYVPYGDQTFGIEGQGVDWRAGSKLGLMVNGAFTPEFGFGVQYLLRQGSSREPRLRTPLAYLEWHPGNWVFKLGRTAPGVALVEDSLHADHGHLWLKPPVEIYSHRTKPQLDGLSVTHQGEWGGWYTSLQAAYGVADYHARSHRRRFSTMAALSGILTKDDLLLRASAHKLHFDLLSLPSNTAFLAGIRAAIPAQYAPEFSEYNIALLSKSVSLSWTPGPWTVQAEWFRTDNDKPWISDYWGSYLLLGHRWGAWTPYLMLGVSKPNDRAETRFSPAINATVNAVRRGVQGTQESQAMGLRYDWSNSVALKVQAERIHRRANEVGAFIPASTPPRAPTVPNGTTVISVSVQGVF